MTVAPLNIDEVLQQSRIIVCCGSGGVGKTTTAAALALRAAESGRRAVVLTIDPARRLAQALGLRELDNTPRAVEGIDTTAGGSLDAMMLDMKRTFDEIVLAYADRERAQQILDNPFYKALSSSFAGTQEYMAMEKLGQLAGQDRWDIIVVDTPPSRSALDFLDAPQRLSKFLDGRLVRLLVAPARFGGRAYTRVLGAGMGIFTGALTTILGTTLLRDVSLFVSGLETMFGGFRERAERTYQLLKRPGTAFLVIAAPERDAMREASYFCDRLSEERMPLTGLVLNRVHTARASELSASRGLAAAEALEGTDHELTTAVLRLHADRMLAAERDARMRERFTSAHPEVRVAQIPALAADVHDLPQLRAIGKILGQQAQLATADRADS